MDFPREPSLKISPCLIVTGKRNRAAKENLILSEGSSNRHIEIFAFRFSKKGKYPSKGHGPRAIEYVFLTQGEMSVEIDKEPIKMVAGDLLEFRASSTHTYIQDSKNFAEGLNVVFFGV